ncbi:unnamed protein product [Larinioides sclopetarius]|uniref:Uncharacterized protein n=1 Tax=Larinioides sclopetarius TaxID=280406 RepID=A0AAV1ZPM7_9ARAC
MESSHCFGV